MKKTGKALSLVLSLALVVSSLTATFASAATPASDPVVGAAVTLPDTDIALAVDSKATVATTGVTLPTPTITYTTADGKEYDESATQVDKPSHTWTSSNPAVAKISQDGTTVIPVAAGTVTLTCSVANDQVLTYGTDANKNVSTVKVTGSKSISAKVYNKGDYILTDVTTPGDGVVPKTATTLAVNDETPYGLYQVSIGTSGAAKFTQATKIDAVESTPAAGDVLEVASDKSKVIPTAKVLDGTTTTAAVTAQPADLTKLYIGSDQITAMIYNTTSKKVVKTLASQPVTVAKRFNAKGVAAITGNASYGSNKTNATATVSDGKGATESRTYDVTGYDIYNVDTAITLTDVAVGNVVDATKAVTVKGGTVGKITSTDAVTISDDKDNKVTTSVASVAATGAVTVSNDEVACSVGDIASDGAVTIDGTKTTTGDVRAKGNIAVGGTAPGATTGSLIGVATIDSGTQATNLVKDYPTVTVTGSTVKGDIVGQSITVTGVDAATANDNTVPATVNGNITVYSNTKTTTATGSVTVGDASANKYRIANVTVGNITAANAGSTITVQQGTAGDGKTTSTTTVGTLNGFAPEKTGDTTAVNFVNYTGSFASLPNFTTVSVDANSDVKVASALATTELTVNGTAELAGGATVEDAVSGTGTLKMPAGKLIAKKSIGGATPINFVPTSAVKVGDVLFSSIAGMESNVSVEGVTIDSKASATVTNGYDYYAKTVKGTGLSITGDKVANNKTTVAAGSTKTLTATVVPEGQTLPQGEKVAWSLTNGNRNITITPSSDTLSATVAAKAYDSQDTDSVNEDTVTAYVVDANGNKDINYKSATCDIQATPAVTLTTTVTDLDGNVMTVTPDTVVKIQQSTELRVHFNADIAGISDINYVTGNDKVAQTNTVSAWNGTSGVYTIYTNGAVGSKVGVYAAGHKVFQVEITDRPFKCDTSVDFTMKAGKTYTFKITPNAGTKIDNFTFLTGNDSKLSTWGCWKQADGTEMARVKAVSAGRYGVYAKINGVTYKVFAITVQ
jgi:hypothetical protein